MCDCSGNNDVIPTVEYKTTIKSLHSGEVSLSADNLTVQCVFQKQTSLTPTGLPFPRSVHRFVSLQFYRERIGQTPSSLSPSTVPHANVCIFSCSLHTAFLTVRDSWERPRLTSELLFALPFFDLPPLPPPSPEPPPSNGHES